MANYYVAPNGNNSTGNGSEASPWLTINSAGNKAAVVAGDTILVKGLTVAGWLQPIGVYREFIQPKNGITIKAYPGHLILIDACDLVTGWTLHSGNIWKATVTITNNTVSFPSGNNLVFWSEPGVLPIALTEARWPKVPTGKTVATLERDDWAIADSATQGTGAAGATVTSSITDAALSIFSAGSLVGKTITFLPGGLWGIFSGPIITHSGNTIQFTQKYRTSAYMVLQADSRYFLFNALDLLTQPGEWFLDETTDLLYLWLPNNGNPNNYEIRFKNPNRAKSYDFFDRSNITVEDITVIGGRVNSSSLSTGLTFRNCTFINPTHALFNEQPYTTYVAPAMLLAGTGCTVENCTIEDSAAGGISIVGSSTIRNCTIKNTTYNAYTGGSRGGITVAGSNNLVEYNTIDGSGASRQINVEGASNTVIQHNTIINASRLGLDEGAIMVFRNTNGGTNYLIINNNIIDVSYHIYDASKYYYGYAAAYFEECLYVIFAENVCKGSGRIAFKGASSSSTFVKFINNTLNGDNLFLESTAFYAGTEFINNFFRKFQFSSSLRPDVSWQNNATQEASYSGFLYAPDPGFADGDYNLLPTSPLRNAGVVAAPWTDGYFESAPDIGAKEYEPEDPVDPPITEPINIKTLRKLIICGFDFSGSISLPR